MDNNQTNNSQFLNKVIQIAAPILAALFYGLWAGYSNYEYGLNSALSAGIIQGSFAFISTWLLTYLISWSIKRAAEPKKLVIFSQCASLLVGIPLGLHIIASTPNILEAMLPGAIIGNSYAYGLIRRLIPST
jgi:hypothetical protein